MKTIIITTLLSVGVFLRPELAPKGSDAQVDDGTKVATSAVAPSTAPRILEEGETSSMRGGGIGECYSYYDANFDEHGICCLSLWLFSLCVDVNVSEIGRFISSVF
jgi:hypothetical protein